MLRFPDLSRSRTDGQVATAVMVRTRRIAFETATVALFAILAVAATWPLARRLDDAIPIGTERVETVPLLNLWTVWWNADRAQHFFNDYWQAPIFHPVRNTFAFSEPQPSTLVVAPLVWASDTPALAYNVYLLAALVLNGWSAFRLLSAVGLMPLPALCGGVMLEMLPFVHWQLGVLQLVPVFGVLWTIHALHRLRRNAMPADGEGRTSSDGAAPARQALADGALLGGAYALTFWMCTYYALFFGLLLLICGWSLMGRSIFRRYVWGAALAAAAVAIVLIGPIVSAQLRVAAEHRFAWDIATIRSLSAEWGDYSVTPWPELLPSPQLSTDLRGLDWQLGVGTVKYLLAAAGLIFGLSVRPLRRWTLFCAGMTLWALLLSRGPRLSLGEWSPYMWLVCYAPGFPQARNVFRFAVFVQLGVVFLAAGGLQAVAAADLFRFRRLGDALCTWPRLRTASLIRTLAVLALGFIAAAEVRPGPQALFVLPDPRENRSWLNWLSDHTPTEAAAVCIPFERGPSVWEYREASHWMYWSMFHHRRIANGYSGRFPSSHEELYSALAGFPDERSLAALRQIGVSYCIVQRPAVRQEHALSSGNLERVFADDSAQIDIYRIR